VLGGTIKEVETGFNMAESTKENCGSERRCFTDDDDDDDHDDDGDMPQ
jgi:hypothetical protein